MMNIIRKITRRTALRGLTTLVSALVIIVAIAAIVLPRLISAVPLTVLSGSMEPVFNPGDLVISQPVDPAEVRVGDIVTFQPVSDDPELITHRVESTSFDMAGGLQFITRGDANNVSDKVIVGDQVVGRYLYHVPLVGYLAVAIPSDAKPVIMQVLGIGLLLGAAFYGVRAVTGRKQKTAPAPASTFRAPLQGGSFSSPRPQAVLTPSKAQGQTHDRD